MAARGIARVAAGSLVGQGGQRGRNQAPAAVVTTFAMEIGYATLCKWLMNSFNIESKVMLSGHVRKSHSILELIWIRKWLCARRRIMGGDTRRPDITLAVR